MRVGLSDLRGPPSRLRGWRRGVGGTVGDISVLCDWTDGGVRSVNWCLFLFCALNAMEGGVSNLLISPTDAETSEWEKFCKSNELSYSRAVTLVVETAAL